ncbi:aaa family atpase [Fusarium sporotrichioides]|uniref:Aaa family atpase n=1 Tax=Fusarium sporotrichioides TaxID=5514 RepID=A0A395S8I8_FUSSP|nr:aaa family atpase [Fusarium sporotrichioides]
MSLSAENRPIATLASGPSKVGNDPNTPNEHGRDHGNETTDDTTGDSPSLEQRFAALESKLKIVDNAFNLGQATEHFIKQENEVPLESMSSEELQRHYEAELLFYWDIEREMKLIRDAELAAKSSILKEEVSETSRDLSIEAFSNGVRAEVIRVDWEVFVATKGGLEGSILSPIEVVTSEPEPQVILRLSKPSAGGPTMAKSVGHRPTEKTVWERDESLGEKPLPERIKIHSNSLVVIFCKVMEQTDWALAKDKSMVFLRPFRELIYYETKLREHLSKLEKQFEGCDGRQLKPTILGIQDSGDLRIRESEEHLESSSAKEVPVKEDHGLETPTNDKTQQHKDESQLEKTQIGQKSDKVQGEEKLGSITGLLHMRCLMDFFDNNIKSKLKHVDSPDCTSISFHDLWHLFKPGNRVIDQTEKQAYVVLRVQTPRHIVQDIWLRWSRKPRDKDDSDDDDEEDEVPVLLHCVYIDFDGKQFGPVSKKFKIPQFGGLKDIRSLPVYPFRFAKGAGLQDDLRKRGKMLLDISRFKPMYYMGHTLDTRDEIDSQVVVDFNEALTDEKRRKKWEPTIAPIGTAPEDRDEEYCVAPCCVGQAVHDGEYIDSALTEDFVRSLVPVTSLRSPSLLLSPRPLEDLPRDGEGLSDEELIVMTYRVFGFVLRSRKWAQLDLTFLRYENADARNLSVNAFQRLELPKGHREMVKSLVIQHFRSKQTSFTKDEQTDLIKGKGKGLIMLLHGAPGVGKTTTAEGIAELFKKPLFQITCGDLGSTAHDVEEELERNFALASRWGCILLLDEADVFLSARDRMDFVRNGLVAVFLRVLEYYTGILFLTTNRIGDFDEAFASRVHMSLYYPELDKEKTIRVFELNLELIRDRFKQQGRQVIFDASSITSFARQHYENHKFGRWNGRQIRNLCQTALALAEYDAQGEELDAKIDKSIPVSLQLKYFETVQEAYLSFSEYLGNIRGTKGDRRAIDFGLRARQDTPYQTGPSRFARKADEMASQDWQGNPPPLSSSDSSHYRLASQGDPFQPFNQGHMFASQGTNMLPQQYQPYPQQQQQQYQHHQQQPMTTMENVGYNVSPGLGYMGQSHTDSRMMQSQQSNPQYMQYQQGSQGAPRNMNVNLQGSPVPQNNFQGQQQEQRYSGGPQGQGLTSQV